MSRTSVTMSCTSLSVSVSNLPVLLYLSVACCGSSVHHKAGYSFYIYLQHSTTYIHSVPRTRPFSPIDSTHPLHLFPLHPHAWSSGQSTRGVAEVGRKPRLTSWMASSQTDVISIHFPLHLPHTRVCVGHDHTSPVICMCAGRATRWALPRFLVKTLYSK